MGVWKFPIALALALMLSIGAFPAAAQSAEEVEELRHLLQQMQEQMNELKSQHDSEIEELRSEIRRLSDEPAVDPETEALEREFEALLLEEPSVQPDRVPIGQAIREGRQIGLSNYMDISANVDILGRWGENSRTRGYSNELAVREVELGFSGAVDPYGRFVLYMGFHPGHGHDHDHGDGHDHGSSWPRYNFRTPGLNELGRSLDNLLNWYWENRYWHPREHDHAEWEMHVEEAYFVFDKMPYNLQLKLGKFRAHLGKSNYEHLHALPWAYYPLVVANNFGEEGLMGSGASLSWLVPNPWDHYLELRYEVFKNDNYSLFAGDKARDLVHLGNLTSFWDLNESSTLELGLTAAWGPNDDRHGSSSTALQGIDLTYKWIPVDRSLYRSFSWQSELFFFQKDMPHGREDTYGWYTGVEYQFARRWSAGARYDFAQWPSDSRFREHNYQVFTTFRQSEFAFWRLGFRHRNPNFGSKYNDNEVFLQFNVELGAHGAHRY